MKFFTSLIYGLISGLTEFLPISSLAHQQILGSVFRIDATDPVQSLFVHIGILLAVYGCTFKARLRLSKMRSNTSKSNISKRKKERANKEYRLIQNITISFLILFFFLNYIKSRNINLLVTFVFLLINGFVIFLPERMLQGNKKAVEMSKLDRILIGGVGAFSVFPGVSRVGIMLSTATLRGAERKRTVTLVLILSVPALLAWMVIDILMIFSGTVIPFWSNLLFYLITAVSAYFGARGGIYVLQRYIRKVGCTGFAYYCWGAALFSLILFLTVG